MKHSNIKTSQHVWEKKNLVNIAGRKGVYDNMVCLNCGMKGKRYGFESVEVSSLYKTENVHLCPKAKPVVIPKKIKILHCRAVGRVFENLTPNSVHEIVTPPADYKNDHTGVWVMGVGKPVKVLTREYTEFKD